MCFSDCAAMSMLPLILIPFVLQLLAHGINTECAIGDIDENTQWINSNGRLKNHDDINLDIDNDYFDFQASCLENLENDKVDEFCNCTFTNSKLQIIHYQSLKLILK
jgi:hypothetical protein